MNKSDTSGTLEIGVTVTNFLTEESLTTRKSIYSGKVAPESIAERDFLVEGVRDLCDTRDIPGVDAWSEVCGFTISIAEHLQDD